jgi:hypothetical protein
MWSRSKYITADPLLVKAPLVNSPRVISLPICSHTFVNISHCNAREDAIPWESGEKGSAFLRLQQMYRSTLARDTCIYVF